jgi:hypothetical protein
MALQTKAIARQRLSSDHVGTPTDNKEIIAQQERKDAFCAVLAEIL